MELKATNSSARDAYLEAMSRVAASVSIVTTDGPTGMFGLTVSSLVSVSAETNRPTLLVSIRKEAEAADPLIASREFCVNLLHPDQVYEANLFAGREGLHGQDRFDQIAWHTGATGAPRLDEALVSFDCCVSQIVPVGQHLVVFGEVRVVSINKNRSALLYANRDYASPQPIVETTRPVAA